MSIHVVADTIERLSAIQAILEPRFLLTSFLLRKGTVKYRTSDAIVISADLSQIHTIEALRQAKSRVPKATKVIFVIEGPTRLLVAQAYSLGAHYILFSPARPADLFDRLVDVTPRKGHSRAYEDLETTAGTGLAAVSSFFSAVEGRRAIDVVTANQAGAGLVDSVAEHGLSAWMEVVKRMHGETHRHSLLSTAVAVDFGLHLGLSIKDLRRLSTSSLLHDIGKAVIPRGILDKQGSLNENERAIQETHAAIGFEVLSVSIGFSRDILDAVRHHHELLDGSGYPDGLCTDSISDDVRIIAIADIFSALISRRAYRAPFLRSAAFDIMCSLRGKLDRQLLMAFKDVALSR